LYKGDGSPVIADYPIQSARTYHSVSFTANTFQGSFHDVGQTRAYGWNSPANGSYLSSGDEDGVSNDCYLWHASAYANTNDFHEEVTFPYSTQGQARLYGTGTNPLEPSLGGVSWDMRVVIDYSNLDYIQGMANVTHSCFPAHVIQVNNRYIYQYGPPRSDPSYIFSCLALQQGKIQGYVTPWYQVPCN
jgi:hypothetical protein